MPRASGSVFLGEGELGRRKPRQHKVCAWKYPTTIHLQRTRDKPLDQGGGGGGVSRGYPGVILGLVFHGGFRVSFFLIKGSAQPLVLSNHDLVLQGGGARVTVF